MAEGVERLRPRWRRCRHREPRAGIAPSLGMHRPGRRHLPTRAGSSPTESTAWRACRAASLPAMKTADLTTPALVVDGAGLDANLRTMSEALPGVSAPAPRQGTQVHRSGPSPGHPGAPGVHLRHHPRDGGHGRGPGWDTTCSWRTRWSMPRGSAICPARELGSPSPWTRRRRSHAAARAGVPEVLIDVNVGPAPLRLFARGGGSVG